MTLNSYTFVVNGYFTVVKKMQKNVEYVIIPFSTVCKLDKGYKQRKYAVCSPF